MAGNFSSINVSKSYKELAITNIKAFKILYEAYCFQIALLNMHTLTLKFKYV